MLALQTTNKKLQLLCFSTFLYIACIILSYPSSFLISAIPDFSYYSEESD